MVLMRRKEKFRNEEKSNLNVVNRFLSHYGFDGGASHDWTDLFLLQLEAHGMEGYKDY